MSQLTYFICSDVLMILCLQNVTFQSRYLFNWFSLWVPVTNSFIQRHSFSFKIVLLCQFLISFLIHLFSSSYPNYWCKLCLKQSMTAFIYLFFFSYVYWTIFFQIHSLSTIQSSVVSTIAEFNLLLGFMFIFSAFLCSFLWHILEIF